MKKLIVSFLGLGLVLSVCIITDSARADMLNEDFSGGLQPDRWDIIRMDATGAPWTITVPDLNGWLQLSKAADSDTLATCVGGIASRFQLVGDFTASVAFNLVDFPEPNTSGWNEAFLRIGFSGTPFFNDSNLFEVLWFTNHGTVEKQWLEGWSSQPQPSGAFGQVFDSTLQGSFSITRSGETLSAWIDRGAGPDLIGSATSTMFTGPANIQLLALQQPGLTFPRPSTSIDVRFDNVSISAEAIVPEPSTVILLGIGAISLVAYAWRNRKRGVC